MNAQTVATSPPHVRVVQPNPWVSYGITAVVIALVFALRMRRMTKVRPLRLEQLWIVPAIYAAIVALAFYGQPPSAKGWLAALAGLAVGGAIGWQRGKTVHIHVDPVTGALNQKASIAGMAFLLILLVVKGAAKAGGSAMHFDVGLLTDALLALALGTFTVMRIEMYLRAKWLLAAARGAAIV